MTFSFNVDISEISSSQNSTEKKNSLCKEKGHHANYTFNQIIGTSAEISDCILQAKKYARVDSSILISAPTGCGKEMFAQSIHNSSRRRSMPFVVVNCAALPESLLESILFGYEKGAYTGASREGKSGLFLMADGGTIFLDEISEMPLNLQSRFLRVLQEKEIVPLGSDNVISVDIRVIAATNKNIYTLVKEGKFREDLLFRLAVLELNIPTLNERKDDIPNLVQHFLYTLSKDLQLPCPEINSDALQYMKTQDYPGNVRQLHNIVERLLVLNESNKPLTIDIVKKVLSRSLESAASSESIIPQEKIFDERQEIISAFNETRGNRRLTAEKLHMSASTLWRKIKKYDIEL